MTYQCGPILKESQKQVLYGTILGGSSIVKPAKGKNCYLAMRDSNESWLQYKIEYLKDFFKIDVNTIKKDKNTFRCYSVAYPVFNEIYDLFYEKNSKILIPNILECLTDEAWMVWFIDAGRKSKRIALRDLFYRSQKQKHPRRLLQLFIGLPGHKKKERSVSTDRRAGIQGIDRVGRGGTNGKNHPEISQFILPDSSGTGNHQDPFDRIPGSKELPIARCDAGLPS